ncbi:hypothetical protein IW262DRAFT_1463862 [Armillaria fumosa]|nr:hypothetical protein IW262DRAFT_1463862 [Armillaria fumosa]
MARITFIFEQVGVVLFLCVSFTGAHFCRTVPGEPNFPSVEEWSSLNSSISGRLVKADYESIPPSVCLRNWTNCGQGNVPLYAVLAESVEDVQIGVAFSSTHNLRLAVKASGHDLLDRSTARNSLLVSTHKFQNISFAKNFTVSGHNEGSAVTVGSGVPLNTLYQAAKEQGRIFVGGVAATVVATGGYIQGGGYSMLSPLLGLAADNVLEFGVLTANLTYLKPYRLSDVLPVFWALRGGGAGSWGVLVSTTFRTFPTFNATISQVSIVANDTVAIGSIVTTHAKHIFDWDDLHMGQFFSADAHTLSLGSYFPRISSDAAAAALKPFLDDAEVFEQVVEQQFNEINRNDAITVVDDVAGSNGVIGSRLTSASAYRNHPDAFGHVYTQLFDARASA